MTAMAAQQANQFIGSKISLISKAEIRYEGILYSLDLNDATISLAKVSSMGTEDRPTERPIPPKDEVYEFIIFRGSDIKAIDVVEPPKSAASLSTLPNDPAIVEVSHYHHPMGSSSSAAAASAQSTITNPFGPKTANTNVLSTFIGGGQSPPSKSSGNNDAGVQVGQKRGRQNNANGGGNGGKQKQNNNNNGNNNGNNNNAAKGEGGRGRGRGRGRLDEGQGGRGNGSQHQGRGPRGGGQFDFDPSDPFNMPPFPFYPNFARGGRGRGGGGGGGRGGRGNGGYRSNRNQHQNGSSSHGIIEAQQPAKVTFEEPFDFEKSHEELVQAMVKMSVEEAAAGKAVEGGVGGGGGVEKDGVAEPKPDPDAVYYAKENFFDNISCEALKKNRGMGRVDWRVEQKMNTETFGSAGNNFGNRRGYYRGGGGGYYRGGGGGYPRGPYGPAYFRGGGGGGNGNGNGGYGNYRYPYSNNGGGYGYNGLPYF